MTGAISRLVLLGATGDLAGRLLLPALARLISDGAGGADDSGGVVGDDLVVVGAAPQHLDDAAFARHVTERLDAHAGDVPVAVRQALVERLRYVRVDLDDPATVAEAVRAAGDDGPVAVYLALPPRWFAPAIEALGEARLPAGSRVVVEKPFGAGADDAAALNASLERVTGGVPGAVFRVDHALAMPGLADLAARRRPGGDLAAWDGASLQQVDLLWEETLALEGRADFYDDAGALRDVAQNHLLQLLAVVVGDLASVRPASDAPEGWTRRARYTAGTLASPGGGQSSAVPDYTAEDGVDPGRGTETFAELTLVSSDPRWAGTRFVLRAGKALGADHKAVVAHRRADAPPVAGELAGRRVWIDLDEVSQAGERVAGEVSAYARVLTDVLSGGSGLSVSAAGSEQAWRVVAPALAAWRDGAAALEEYVAGSSGPQQRDDRAERLTLREP